MQKFYLLQSKHPKEDAGDVIIDVNNMKAFFLAKIKENEFLLKIDVQDNSFHAVFSTEEQVRLELKSILHELGQDESIAYKINISDRTEKDFSKKLKEKLISKLIED